MEHSTDIMLELLFGLRLRLREKRHKAKTRIILFSVTTYVYSENTETYLTITDKIGLCPFRAK